MGCCCSRPDPPYSGRPASSPNGHGNSSSSQAIHPSRPSRAQSSNRHHHHHHRNSSNSGSSNRDNSHRRHRRHRRAQRTQRPATSASSDPSESESSDPSPPTSSSSLRPRPTGQSQDRAATTSTNDTTEMDLSTTNNTTTTKPLSPLALHVNRPLRRHKFYHTPPTPSSSTTTAAPTSVPPPRSVPSQTPYRRPADLETWTRARLERERSIFFDTCVEGRAEVWGALRIALATLWDLDRDAQAAASGETADHDRLRNAQAILDAAEITLPTGDLATGAYDALGTLYVVPEWLVADPRAVVLQLPARPDKGKAVADDEKTLIGQLPPPRDAAAAPDVLPKVAARQHRLRLVARVSDPGHDVVVAFGKDEPVREVEGRIWHKANLPPTSRVRLVFSGKPLRQDASLVAQGWQQGQIVNAMVLLARDPEEEKEG